MRAAIILLFAAGFTGRAATYYVDAKEGQDSNPGTAVSAAWKTLAKVNATAFQPGDRILFKSGCVWNGQLVLKTSGSDSNPIQVGRYGAGTRPKLDGEGKVEDVIRLYNVEKIEIRNLELTNHGAAAAVRRGVHIFADNFGTAHHIAISGLYIHDVNGTNGEGDKGKDNGGIIFRTMGDKVPSRFDGLLIERNFIRSVDRSAIAAESFHAMRTHWFPSVHVIIRDNLVDDVGGDGIVPWATEGVLVEHNIARHCNRRAGSYNAGIWPWSTDDSLFQLNEASLTHTTLDGEGFDSDYNSRNTLFQYNYSHDNEGGFMLICTPGERKKEENIGNLGTVIRYNISRNDHTRAFNLSAAEHTIVHDNFIYVGPGIQMQILAATNWSGWAKDAVFWANTFWVSGTASYGHEVQRNKDGTYELAPGWGNAAGIVFNANRYIGPNRDKPEDLEAVIEQSGTPPNLDWEGPAFDPQDPEQFSAFMDAHRAWMLRLFEQQFGRPVKLGR